MTKCPYNLKQLAHLGDAVWELFIREHILDLATNLKQLHNLTTKYVRAEFQANLLNILEEYFLEDEKELLKRGRNLSLTISKRNNQQIHRYATSFEVLIGYLYINDKQRLDFLFDIISKKAL